MILKLILNRDFKNKIYFTVQMTVSEYINIHIYLFKHQYPILSFSSSEFRNSVSVIGFVYAGVHT